MRVVEVCAATGQRETLEGMNDVRERLLFRYPTATPTALSSALKSLQGPPGTLGSYESRFYWYRQQRVEEPNYFPSVKSCT